jgi:hypothetical protein
VTNVRLVVQIFAWSSIAIGVIALGLGAVAAVRGDAVSVVFIFASVAFVGIGITTLFILTKDPAPTGTGQPVYSREPFSLSFTVGEREKHTVVYQFDQFWGWLTITVDGVLTVKSLVTLTFRLVSTFTFDVGITEVHAVRIEKHRALYRSFAKPQPIRAFVDGSLVAETDGRRPA